MIIIGGTELVATDLPFSDMMDYVVEHNNAVLEIRLKTVAKSNNCIAVYLHTDLQEIELVPEVQEKTQYFTDEAHLVSLLDASDDTTQEPEENNVEEAPIAPTFESPETQVEQESTNIPSTEVKPNQDNVAPIFSVEGVEEADTDLPEVFLTIPTVTQDTDSLRIQLENKDRIINQKNGQILQLKNDIENHFKLQELQFQEMRKQFELREEELITKNEELRKQLSTSVIPEDAKEFLRYTTYAKNHKAILRDKFTPEEVESLGKLKSPIFILAGGSGDSYYTMMKQVASLMDRTKNLVVADFSNDHFFAGYYRIRSKETTMLLNDDSVSVESIVREAGQSTLLPTAPYNDIALLNMDWLKIIKKLDQFASGRPLFLLFNSTGSFSNRYSLAKLSGIGKVFVCVKSNPLIISSAHGDLAFIADCNFTVVAMDYIDVVKPILEQLAKRYAVEAFVKDINWAKLGVKV